MTYNCRPHTTAVARALSQARVVKFRYWKSTDPYKEWIQCIGETLRLEKYTVYINIGTTLINLITYGIPISYPPPN